MSKLDDFLELARKKGLSEKERMAELKRLGFKLTKEEVDEHLQKSEKEAEVSEESPASGEKVVEKRIRGNVIRRRRKVVKPKAEVALPPKGKEPAQEAPEGEVLKVITEAQEAPVEKPEAPLLEEEVEVPAPSEGGGETKPEAVAKEPEAKPIEQPTVPEKEVESPQAPPTPVRPDREETGGVEGKKTEHEPVGIKPKKKKKKRDEGARVTGFVDLTAILKKEREEERQEAVKKEKAKPGEVAPPPSPEELAKEGKSGKVEKLEEKTPPKKRPRSRRKWVERDLRKELNEYLAGAKGQGDEYIRASRKHKKERRTARKEPVVTAPIKESKRVIRILDKISVGELSRRMGAKVEDVMKKLLDLGIQAGINETLDADTAGLIAAEFSYTIEDASKDIESVLYEEEDREEDLTSRPPVVTVMGHVDHGKTLLLDAIRKTHVVDEEAGGITQHIGAYEVRLGDPNKRIIFIDTPGHEAFTEMRARGAQVTDIVVLVVAADDGVMPQTVEAINHAKAAGVPIIVAINKIDKPQAQPEKVRQALMEHGLVPENLGGDTLIVEVSAKTRQGIDELLEMILLQAEMMDLKGNPKRRAQAVILESGLDKTRGITATVIVKQGTLKKGDFFVVGPHYGKVRALMNDKGKRIKSAGPSFPVQITGFGEIPEVGETLYVVRNEKEAKQISSYRKTKLLEAKAEAQAAVSLDDLFDKIKVGEAHELNVIVKADVMGSLKAVCESLQKLGNEEVRVNVVHEAVGGISESDINLAVASRAIVIGFNVRPEPKARALAKKEGIEIRVYSIIYDIIDDVTRALTGMLAPKREEKVLGRAEVRATFSVPKVGVVAGCYVVEGEIPRNARVHLLRDNVVIYDGKIASLKRFKDDVKSVQAGYECGLGIENFNDVKVGDMIEAYVMEETAAEL